VFILIERLIPYVIFFIPLRKLPQPFAKGDARREAKVALQGGGVGISSGHVTGLHGHELFVGLEVVVRWKYTRAKEFFLQGLDKVQQVHGLAASDVIHGIGRHGQSVGASLLFGCFAHHTHYALHNIIHVREISAAVAVIVYFNLLSSNQLVRKPEVCHVAGRRVHRR